MPVPNKPSVHLISLLVFSIVLCGACQRFSTRSTEKRPDLPRLESVVVMGFRDAVSERDEPRAARNPVTGGALSAPPVSTEVVNKMTAKLFEGVRKVTNCELISPGKARGVYSRLIASDPGRTQFEMLQQIGKTFSADAVLVGYLYRWTERVGGDLAADQPASVAFDLSLIRSEDGAILWREKFDKTQKSLSENLLEWNTFVRGRGRWMTADKLAIFGLEGMLSRIPIGRDGENE
ncbi:MAG: hypothetical protein JW896_01340 [Deltaproteobacteria bacterium]|nr:hypothetical protein [Deltaproteobacteria bacterium]